MMSSKRTHSPSLQKNPWKFDIPFWIFRKLGSVSTGLNDSYAIYKKLTKRVFQLVKFEI